MSRFFSAYVRWLRWIDWCVVLVSIVASVALFQVVRHLQVRSDFKEMLPEQYRSVQELTRIEQRVRATASLLLLVGGDDWPSMRRFIDDFAVRARAELGDIINRIDVNGEETRAFFETNKYLYVDLEDLGEIYRRLRHHIDKEKLKGAGLYAELGEEKFDIADIEAKYKEKTGAARNYRDGYFTNNEATLAIVVLKPNVGATDVTHAEQLIQRVRAVVEAMQPQHYHASMKYGFGGRYPKVIIEFKTIVGDILRTTLLCLGLVACVILAYFRRVRMGAFMVAAVALGTLGALAIAYATIGYLTTQTAFLGSIIVGNGINFSIILMARYVEERRRGASEEPALPVRVSHDFRGTGTESPMSEALTIALQQTWAPTCVAALTAAGAYAALSLTQIRGFSQFGLIGGTGMVLCWLATYATLPAWIACSERIWPMRLRADGRHPFLVWMGALARWIVRSPRTICAWCAGCSVVAAGLIVWYLPRSLEYDFNKLRFKPAALEETWEAHARDQADTIFGQSASPSVILAERPDQVAPICAEIEARGRQLIGEEGQAIFDSCKSLLTYVPKDQEAKLGQLKEIRALLSGSALRFLTEAQRAEVERFRATFSLQPVTVADLPRAVVDNFAEMDGRTGLVLYVYPKPEANLWHGKELVKFANLIRRVDLPTGEAIYSSGEAVIFADLLQAVVREGPRLTLYSFCLVLLIVVLNFRERAASGYVLASLLVGVGWLVAALAVAGVKLNFLNFVALPITFGIGVDYAVNIFQRYRQDGRGSMEHVVRNIGGAVFLCSLTTIIGYSVLLISRNRALVSFGAAALLGEVTCLVAALVGLPALICWRERSGKAR